MQERCDRVRARLRGPVRTCAERGPRRRVASHPRSTTSSRRGSRSPTAPGVQSEFDDALSVLFNPVGAVLLEGRILKRFYHSIGMRFEWNEARVFKEEVEEASRQFRRANAPASRPEPGGTIDGWLSSGRFRGQKRPKDERKGPQNRSSQESPPPLTVQGEVIDSYRVPADADADSSAEFTIVDRDSFGSCIVRLPYVTRSEEQALDLLKENLRNAIPVETAGSPEQVLGKYLWETAEKAGLLSHPREGPPEVPLLSPEGFLGLLGDRPAGERRQHRGDLGDALRQASQDLPPQVHGVHVHGDQRRLRERREAPGVHPPPGPVRRHNRLAGAAVPRGRPPRRF